MSKFTSLFSRFSKLSLPMTITTGVVLQSSILSVVSNDNGTLKKKGSPNFNGSSHPPIDNFLTNKDGLFSAERGTRAIPDKDCSNDFKIQNPVIQAYKEKKDDECNNCIDIYDEYNNDLLMMLQNNPSLATEDLLEYFLLESKISLDNVCAKIIMLNPKLAENKTLTTFLTRDCTSNYYDETLKVTLANNKDFAGDINNFKQVLYKRSSGCSGEKCYKIFKEANPEIVQKPELYDIIKYYMSNIGTNCLVFELSLPQNLVLIINEIKNTTLPKEQKPKSVSLYISIKDLELVSNFLDDFSNSWHHRKYTKEFLSSLIEQILNDNQQPEIGFLEWVANICFGTTQGHENDNLFDVIEKYNTYNTEESLES